MSYLPGKFVWFEHASNDVAKARAFYESLFGWHIDRVSMGDRTYDMIMNGQDGIGGLREAEPGATSHWAAYMSVPDVDKSFAAATAAGAKPLVPPVDFGPAGRGAAVVDPTGAAVSLWKGAEGDRVDLEKVPFGDWCWNELWTGDAKAALAFYEGVFGYTHDAMDMGPQGTYYVLKSGDKPRAGLMELKEPRPPAMWVPYVHVADCDATTAKAAELGAQTMAAPTDVAGVGRFSILLDPLGAAFAVITPV